MMIHLNEALQRSALLQLLVVQDGLTCQRVLGSQFEDWLTEEVL